MFIFKNAWISITRNKGRNILIGVIILVIACACTITLAINNTAKDLIDSYSNAYQKEMTLSFNRKQMMGDFDIRAEEGREKAKERFENIASYTVEDVENFAGTDHIESYYYTYSVSLNGNNIEKAEIETNSPPGGFGGGRGGKNQPGTSSMDFTLTGYSSAESMSEFIDGKYKMTEIADNAWEIAFNGNYVFINQELATYNELGLNSKIILEDSNGTTYEFEVIGIYEENDSEESSMSMFSNSANTIITNAKALIEIDNGNETITGKINPTFIIDDYNNAEKIQDAFYEKGLDETYIVETNEEMAEAGVSSIKNVKSFAQTFLIITLIIGGIVLFILNMINIRERKYEIGVFRTIGISKFKLTMQFMVEILVVALMALTIGAGLGATMSKSVSNSLLSNEIENSTTSAEEMRNNFGGDKGGMPGENMPNMKQMAGVPAVQAYDSIDAVVNVKVLLELLAIGVSLVLVSSVASMISIQRFSPLTILKERS
ncbi:MAG: ABC transporter permease [Bacilli bacterium]|nr:ABC transporter permease [Bacilli bacterium]